MRFLLSAIFACRDFCLVKFSLTILFLLSFSSWILTSRELNRQVPPDHRTSLEFLQFIEAGDESPDALLRTIFTFFTSERFVIHFLLFRVGRTVLDAFIVVGLELILVLDGFTGEDSDLALALKSRDASPVLELEKGMRTHGNASVLIFCEAAAPEEDTLAGKAVSRLVTGAASYAFFVAHSHWSLFTGIKKKAFLVCANIRGTLNLQLSQILYYPHT